MPLITKECFGTVISSLNKMRECARCNLLAECRSINWSGGASDGPLVTHRRRRRAGERDRVPLGRSRTVQDRIERGLQRVE